ncbi:MAG: FkbM family methyltransferase [Ignavibacteriae bacterium]|nr:FkbM family methyltransferase [Ignavibacteriota bacterium]NOG97074.1 FkbM family methyltransferase [Ignavibacteriota bacterium]
MKLFLEQILKGPYNFFTDKFFREFLKLTLFYGDVKRYEPKKINLLKHKIEVPDCLSFIWQFKEIFVDGQYKFNCQIDNPIIYDCGSNIGLSLIYFKNLFPQSQIKAFEPNSYIMKFLKNNIRENKLDNIELYEEAVWIHNDGVEFTDDKADTASISESNGSRVKSIRLKSLIENENKIHFLKFDIEGAEVEVLKDCKSSLENVENIFIEYHSFVNRKQELDTILKILTESDFRYFMKPAVSKKYPFINKLNKNNPDMDFQLNIFAYKENENSSSK